MKTIYTLSFLFGALVLAPVSLFASVDTPEPATIGISAVALGALFALRSRFRRR